MVEGNSVPLERTEGVMFMQYEAKWRNVPMEHERAGKSRSVECEEKEDDKVWEADGKERLYR